MVESRRIVAAPEGRIHSRRYVASGTPHLARQGAFVAPPADVRVLGEGRRMAVRKGTI